MPVANSAGITHLSAPAQETQKPTSLVQHVLDALRESKVESHKVQKYLPDFFEKLREDLGKELRGGRTHKSEDHNQPANQVPASATTSASVAFAYQSVSLTSISLSIRS